MDEKNVYEADEALRAASGSRGRLGADLTGQDTSPEGRDETTTADS